MSNNYFVITEAATTTNVYPGKGGGREKATNVATAALSDMAGWSDVEISFITRLDNDIAAEIKLTLIDEDGVAIPGLVFAIPISTATANNHPLAYPIRVNGPFGAKWTAGTPSAAISVLIGYRRITKAFQA